MLKKHEPMWLGKLENIKVTKKTVDHIPGSRSFTFALYREGPKKRELDQLDIIKEIKYVVIEPAYSEWAPTVLFEPKKDGKYGFGMELRKLNQASVKHRHTLSCTVNVDKIEYFSSCDRDDDDRDDEDRDVTTEMRRPR